MKPCRFKSKIFGEWLKGTIIGEQEKLFRKHYLISYYLRFTDIDQKEYTEHTELVSSKDVIILNQ